MVYWCLAVEAEAEAITATLGGTAREGSLGMQILASATRIPYNVLRYSLVSLVVRAIVLRSASNGRRAKVTCNGGEWNGTETPCRQTSIAAGLHSVSLCCAAVEIISS